MQTDWIGKEVTAVSVNSFGTTDQKRFTGILRVDQNEYNSPYLEVRDEEGLVRHCYVEPDSVEAVPELPIINEQFLCFNEAEAKIVKAALMADIPPYFLPLYASYLANQLGEEESFKFLFKVGLVEEGEDK